MVKGYDAIVIGAGPAGAASSAILADNDIDTLLIEQEKLPRQKICGGAVSKKALKILENANVKIPKLKTFKKCDSMQLSVFDFNSIENLANINFENVIAYLTDRDEFDYAIVCDAVSKGVKLKENSKVKNIKKENSNFIVYGNNFSVKSKYLLCADGVNGISARVLGFRDKWNNDEVFLCIESNVMDYEPPPSPINLYFGIVKWGYAWFFDKGNHASIGIGTVLKEASNLKQLFESFIKNCEYITSTENLKINAWRIPATGGISGEFANGNALFLGDCAGLVDPSLCEGIAYAIQSGKIAAECVINNKVDNYSKTVNKEITSDLKYARILMKFVELDPRRFAKLLSDDQRIAGNVAKILYGNSTYQRLLKNTFKKILMNPLKLF